MKGIIKLIIACSIIFVFFAYIGPAIVNMFPTWVAYNKVQEEYGLHSGMLYYTDLPIIKESEAAVRAGVAAGMELWKENHNM